MVTTGSDSEGPERALQVNTDVPPYDQLPRATLADLRRAAQPLTDGEAGDYDALLKLIDEAMVVLLGVSSLGTHELFRARAELTTRLIEDKGFVALAVPVNPVAVQRLNAFVLGRTEDALWRRFAISSRRPDGCGGTPRCSISSVGFATTTINSQAKRTKFISSP